MYSRNYFQRAIALSVSGFILFSQTVGAQPVTRGATPLSQQAQGPLDPIGSTPTDPLPGSLDPIPADPIGGGTTPPASTEPGLSIPNMPTNPNSIFPTSPGGLGGLGGLGGNSGMYPPNSPYAPWNPYNYGSTWKPGMMILEQSMLPGVVCPLVDNRPHVELLVAINNLFNYVLPDDNCSSGLNPQANNGGFGGLGGLGGLDPASGDLAKQMQAAGASLTTIYKGVNDGTMPPGEIDLGIIQGHIGTIVGGVDRLGRVVSNSPWMNSAKCGNSKQRMGQFLKSMGELVTSLAPYALLLAAGTATGTVAAGAGVGAGAAATGGAVSGIAALAAKPALKYVLGAFGVGSIAKVYSDMIETDSIDMEKPDQREALQQNLCEYFRIEQRVNYLKLADMGQIRNINERMKIANAKLSQFKKASNAALTKSFPVHVLQMSAIETDMTSQLSTANKSIQNAKREMSEVTKLNTNSGFQAICTTGKMLASAALDPDSFVGKTLQTYDSIMKKQTRVTFAQQLLVQTEKVIRDTLTEKKPMSQSRIQCAPGTTCAPFEQCASIAKGYFTAFNSILSDADQRVKNLQSSLESQLTKDPDFKEFKVTLAAVRKEVLIRENTGKLVAMLANDTAAIIYGEINRQMDILKVALMAKPRMLRKAPVLNWLQSSETQFARSLKVFEIEIENFEKDSEKATQTYRKNVTVPVGNGKVKKLDDMSGRQLMHHQGNDIALKNKLGIVNPKTAPLGSKNQENTCMALQRMTLRWHTTIGHLKAQKFFCDSIRPLIFGDALVDKEIGLFCFGQVNTIDGTVSKKSDIEKNLIDLSTKYGERARMVDAKFRELQCETKDAVQVMGTAVR